MRSESWADPSSTSLQSFKELFLDIMSKVDFSIKVSSISTESSSSHFWWAQSKTNSHKGRGWTASRSSLRGKEPNNYDWGNIRSSTTTGCFFCNFLSWNQFYYSGPEYLNQSRTKKNSSNQINQFHENLFEYFPWNFNFYFQKMENSQKKFREIDS